MKTTVGDLKELLELFEDGMEVRVAMQPSWPMEHRLSADSVAIDESTKVLYLAEDGQVGYLPGNVQEELGW